MNISYRRNASGTLVGTWPGKSVRVGSKISKPDQIYLGKVIDKEKNIFWTRERGYFTFDYNFPNQLHYTCNLGFLPRRFGSGTGIKLSA